MRGLKRNPWLFGRGVLLAILVVYGGHARADVATDLSGSIVIFPKVIADGTRDTLIQLTNTSNMPAQAHCFYIASGSCSLSASVFCNSDLECPSGESCLLPCNEADFDLFLTAQQPTMWRVSTGRLQVARSTPCKINQSCSCTVDTTSGQLICPGNAPGTGSENSPAVRKPPTTNFHGELKCVQVQRDGTTPVGQNSLKGEAVIETLASGQISEYNAVTVGALGGLNTNNDLNLITGSISDPTSGVNEFNSCPADLILNHYEEGVTETVPGGQAAVVTTELTLVPCTELLEQQIPVRTEVGFSICNEFEQCVSASTQFSCFLNVTLADIGSIPNVGGSPFTVGSLGSSFGKTRITPPSSTVCLTGSRQGLTCIVSNNNSDCPGFATTLGGTALGCRPWPGVVGVAEEFHRIAGKPAGTAAVNLHMEGSRSAPGDIIVLPEGVVPSGG